MPSVPIFYFQEMRRGHHESSKMDLSIPPWQYRVENGTKQTDNPLLWHRPTNDITSYDASDVG